MADADTETPAAQRRAGKAQGRPLVRRFPPRKPRCFRPTRLAAPVGSGTGECLRGSVRRGLSGGQLRGGAIRSSSLVRSRWIAFRGAKVGGLGSRPKTPLPFATDRKSVV